MIAAPLDHFAVTEEGGEMLGAAPRLSAWLKAMTSRKSFAETSWQYFGGGERAAA